MSNSKAPVGEKNAESVKSAPTPVEPTYTAEELAAHADLFECKHDIVAAALDFAKVKSCTLAEAKAIVQKFAGRKVN